MPTLCADAGSSGASAVATSAAAGWSRMTCECCIDAAQAWQRASTTEALQAQPPPQVRRTWWEEEGKRWGHALYMHMNMT